MTSPLVSGFELLSPRTGCLRRTALLRNGFGLMRCVRAFAAGSPHIAARGGAECRAETLLWGVTGEVRGAVADELPGIGRGNALADTLAEAGYALT